MSSTAYNPDGFLDERELERLANAFFAGPPSTGVSSTGTPSQSAAQQPLASQEFGYGAGASTDTPFRSSTPVPHSVTGSGISPSAIQQGNAVDLADPQTSLPDPNGLGLGHVPGSTSGSGGASPGTVPFGQSVNFFEKPTQANQVLPFENEHTFHEQLRQALAAVNVSGPSSQFAFTPKSIPDERAYYFSPGATGGQSIPPFNLNWVRNDFPILQERVNGRPLIWLDNAATTHKPQQVIDRLGYFYAHENSNIHRAAHTLAARATDAYEEARQKVQHFLNAASPNEIVFVRGTTEAINLVAQSWGDQYLQEGDEIIITHLEHHANIVPWQLLAAKKGLKIKVIPVDDDGQVILEEYAKLLSPKTKLVSFTLVSNALGTVTPAKRIVELAHQAGARVLADGAQSVSHIRTDVQALDADWFVFSGHKIFGPTGIGVLYGKEDLLNQTQPWQGGGNMIKDVTFEHTQYHDSPSRFEAGTGNIADAVGLGAALDYVNKIGIDLIYQYEHYLLHYAINLLKDIPGLRLIGTAKDKTSVLSFVLAGYRTEEVGEALSKNGIAVRSGHHCAQPILRRFGVESTVRPSLAFYNTCTEIDTLVSTIWDIKRSGRR